MRRKPFPASARGKPSLAAPKKKKQGLGTGPQRGGGGPGAQPKLGSVTKEAPKFTRADGDGPLFPPGTIPKVDPDGPLFPPGTIPKVKPKKRDRRTSMKDRRRARRNNRGRRRGDE